MRPSPAFPHRRESRRVSAPRSGLNSVMLIGRLVADPELCRTSSGVTMTRFRVATNVRGTAEFHSVVAWGRLGQLVARQFTMGQLIRVDGSLHSRSWKATSGETRRITEVVADWCYTVPLGSEE
jgi:single-strand DNA-binding protein